jgi:DNA-binding transcriptional MerR regulator
MQQADDSVSFNTKDDYEKTVSALKLVKQCVNTGVNIAGIKQFLHLSRSDYEIQCYA